MVLAFGGCDGFGDEEFGRYGCGGGGSSTVSVCVNLDRAVDGVRGGSSTR
jgi:hypothetical protein